MERMYLEKVQQLVFFSIVMLAFKISHVKIILSVVGSVILISRRQSSELYPPSWRNLWKEWQLQGLVLLSLTAQIVLVIFGNRRKYIAKTWIQAIVWSSYLLADSVATMAIGILSNNVAEVYWNGNSNAHASDYELMAFWAPFLLLHMGGMDTVTAFSLEDNELWMRHFFTVIIQAVTTVYILLMSWSTSSHLSPPYIVVFFVGLVKYCERVWALFSASEKRFRDSIPEIPTSESKIMEACKLKQLEGYHVTAHQVLEVEVPVFDNSVPDCDDAIEILLAHSFLEMVKRLFADLVLGYQDRDASRAIFESIDMDHHKALKVIEVELGLIYDVMYTKATIVYSSWGIAGRIIGSLLILAVLVMVSLDKAMAGENSSKIDITMTLVLLVVALLLDSCAFGELILSDQTAHWLIKHRKTTTLRAINRIRTMIPTNWGRKRKRWSKTMEQLSLLSFCFATKVKPLFCLRILKVLGIEEVAEIYVYKRITPPAQLCFGRFVDLPNEIFRSVKGKRSWAENNGQGTDLKSLFGRRGGMAINRYGGSDLEWSVEMEFHQSILIWHLATEICHRLDYICEPTILVGYHSSVAEFHADFHYRSKCMSRYMLYLLVEHPNMLPIGMGQIKFRELYTDLGEFVEMYVSKPLKDVTEKEASKMLMEIVNPENMLVGGGSMSNVVILHGCKLASQLGKFEQQQKWEIIVNVWIEMMGHAASQCKGRHHAQQLRRGGEYLTHLWLLMAHFGYTDNFQILRSRPIAGAVLRTMLPAHPRGNNRLSHDDDSNVIRAVTYLDKDKAT
ncbi:hypothetical protein RHMOL_Rhmol09G0053900 [Rhododendron molle]|uniref:Uncharacterized protein n=1 Tax=Rhododendron molle TaxID=49168 RepID=A0ACC0MAP6_RHOML|nr:hypothetical protein RHMOL_Rhmol09G0053900 [Rhododendron molle]